MDIFFLVILLIYSKFKKQCYTFFFYLEKESYKCCIYAYVFIYLDVIFAIFEVFSEKKNGNEDYKQRFLFLLLTLINEVLFFSSLSLVYSKLNVRLVNSFLNFKSA